MSAKAIFSLALNKPEIELSFEQALPMSTMIDFNNRYNYQLYLYQYQYHYQYLIADV